MLLFNFRIASHALIVLNALIASRALSASHDLSRKKTLNSQLSTLNFLLYLQYETIFCTFESLD